MAYFKCSPTSSGGDIVELLTDLDSSFVSVNSYRYTDAVVGKHYLILVDGIRQNSTPTISWSGADVIWSKSLSTTLIISSYTIYSRAVLALMTATDTTISTGYVQSNNYCKLYVAQLD